MKSKPNPQPPPPQPLPPLHLMKHATQPPQSPSARRIAALVDEWTERGYSKSEAVSLANEEYEFEWTQKNDHSNPNNHQGI